MKEDKEKLVNLVHSVTWAGDNSRRDLTFLENTTNWNKKICSMFWNLTVAVFYNRNLQETCAYLHNSLFCSFFLKKWYAQT